MSWERSAREPATAVPPWDDAEPFHGSGDTLAEGPGAEEAGRPGRSAGDGFPPESGGSGGVPPRTGSGQHRSLSRARVSARLRARAGRTRRVRQRPIRSALTVLLIIPLVSLIALWAYAASSTVGGAIAKRNSDTVNKDIGAPTQALFLQLTQERAETFVWQSAQGALSLMPRAVPRAQRARAEVTAAGLHSGLVAQRKQTDAAVSAFRAAAATAYGAEPPAGRAAVAALVAKLGQLGGIRAAVDGGTMQPLAAFQAYNDVMDVSLPFSRGALANPDVSIPFYQLSEGVGYEAEALEYIGREAALMGGALVTGDRMSPTEHQLFAQAVDDQRFVQQLGQTSVYWQQTPDPYLPVYASPAYAAFKAMEDRIVAASPGARLPVSPAAWQSGLQAVMGSFIQAENTARLAVTAGATHAGNVVLLRLFVVGGAGLAAVLISAVLLLSFGNRITRELTGLRRAARTLADERLPALVDRLRDGEDVDVDAEAPPLTLRTKTREVTETADAFSAVRHTAVEAAVGQAQMRKGISSVFRSLARRNQSLLQRQLKMLDEMERGTQDPDALAQLFRLDHLTTRMRRQAEGLIIVSGAAPGRGWRQPVPLVEVLRGAIGEIEDYSRVDMVTESRDFMPGAAVADVTHLLAELIENATLYSPPNTRVQVRASRVANGYVVEVEDRGLGIPAGTLATLNERLTRPPEFDLANSDQLGLFVVSRLAARHGIKVALRGSAYGGTAAIVLMPHHLVLAEEDVPALAVQGAVPAQAVVGLGGSAGANTSRRGPRLELSALATGPSSEEMPATAGTADTDPLAGQGRPAQTAPPAEQRDLPRRLRQASLAPELRDAPSAPGKSRGKGRSADQARALISSIQQGWRSGRAAADKVSGDSSDADPGSGEGETRR